MTRVHKARDFCLGLLQTWRDAKGESVPEPFSEKNSETPLSAVNNIKFSRGRLSASLTGVRAKNMDMKVRKCEICDFEELKDDSSVCKACLKHSPQPGSSGGNIVKWSNRGVNSKSGHESWRSNNTVRSIMHDAGAKQWAHMVCTLWMPGTRCLNMGTMGAFDVSRVTNSRRKAVSWTVTWLSKLLFIRFWFAVCTDIKKSYCVHFSGSLSRLFLYERDCLVYEYFLQMVAGISI